MTLNDGWSVWRTATQTPHAIALIAPDGREVTFGEVAGSANQLTHALRARGLAEGDVLALVVPNDITFFVAALAAMQTGMHVVPVNWLLAGGEAHYIVTDSGAGAVVAQDAALVEQLQGAGPLPPHRFVVEGPAPEGWESLDEMVAAHPRSLPTQRTAGELMGYTSGTTGRPKGVQRALTGLSPEQSLQPFLRFLMALGLRGDVQGAHLLCSPIYHSAPGGFALGSLHLGNTVVIQPKFDAAACLEAITRYQITDTHMVPTHFHRLLQLPGEIRAAADVSSLASVVHAGASCPVHVKNAMIEWVGPVLWEYLGATEGAVAMVSSEEWLEHPGTVGRPLPGLSVALLDDDGAPVEPGESGTIYFTVAGNVFEYHNDPEKTAGTRHGDLATVGDVGRIDDDGYLYVLDRRVDMVVSGGVNIYPAELENHLLGHPAVADAVAFGVPDDEWGNRLVCVVSPRPDATPADTTAQAHLRATLLDHITAGMAPYKKPRVLEFGPVPRSPNGKLLRRVAREDFLDRTSTPPTQPTTPVTTR